MVAKAKAVDRFFSIPATAAFVALTGALALAASPALPMNVQVAMLAFAVIVSLPHGAIDIVVAERWLRPRLGQLWLPSFLLAYVAAASATLLLWQMWADAALGLFLAMSVFHFGATEPPGDRGYATKPVMRLARVVALGGVPILIPALAHPAQIEALFTLLIGAGGQPLAEGLHAQGPLVWGAATLIAVFGAGSPRSGLVLAMWLAGVAAAFVLLPPLAAFALYFGLLHSPLAIAHVSQVVGMSWKDLFLASAWPSSFALTGIMLGWWVLQRQVGQADAAIQIAFVGLAALTVPHMILAAMNAPISRWNQEPTIDALQ